MPRPHEDIEHHTLVDHRPGGPPIGFSTGTWCAVDTVDVEAKRCDAAVASYETLIEKARTSSAKATTAVVFRSANHRRVFAVVGVGGHEGFRHLTAAWDDHHLYAERHALAASSSLKLYRCVASAGDAFLDPASTAAYTWEHVLRDPQHVGTMVGPLERAPGFGGLLVFGTDDGTASIVVCRFLHAEEIATFRASPAALESLGPVRGDGDTMYALHPIKTFE